ncbi:type III secretion system inner membrane ring lipoprotein SctJ [Pantoea agglomerans]|uniref:type III secretion system inner membrane ring lipoprotein SctJ n=1 Tax=Enterobacter agglomerans TaxID=549 RepID=UPI0013B954F4|nr:type III secretion inner membrane ring lipoprotein SctJ [Pantoea agglomerans]NEG59866.1 EscJ/YscJ/HrcJ family type III secretion inner membrane ring protein [Pantoea agglomerans]NEG98835.1 EscJ/YscJ/HrcJ family type III secretion inner membrane ring protein [Pantoea agglomerans]NEH05181.1 EscJ/YscJ/HrcJ family type III secretion inner membrane ring protein [Pantoea agglomerans]NEH16170.1 EscJ/YscJ/HrcJ family type III secretion inner membrane ring protein [Pantoea agglomerans]
MIKHCHAICIIVMTLLLSACNDENLLYNITQDQANQVLAILQQHNIYATKEGTLKTGYTVTVSAADRTEALSLINQYQLPLPAEVQIAQAFPADSLVASPNAEQARVISLQEQRLEQSLRLIPQVVNARIHANYPSFTNDFADGKPGNHVAALIIYNGAIDENTFIPQIKALIKNSFTDILYENISVELFNAPDIQYGSPTTTNFLTSPWFIIAFIILLATAGAAPLAFYQYTLRKKKQDQQILPSQIENGEQ